jgi:hypothetical protein
MTCFGWSLGDIAAAITVLVRVVTALREVGGAATDYQEVVSFLGLVVSTLRSIQIHNNDFRDTGHLADLSDQVNIIQQAVMSFIQTIRPYDKHLGPERKAGWYRGMPSKAKWALFIAKSARKMMERVNLPMTVINVNTGLQIL